jgi:hypothetical protein
VADGRTILLLNGMEASDLDLASVWGARRRVNTVTVARMRLLCSSLAEESHTVAVAMRRQFSLYFE